MAHARVLHDRQSDIAKFFRQGRLRACAQTIRLYGVDLFEVEFAPIFPVASTGSENGVIQVHNDLRFPKSCLIVGGRSHQMQRGGAAEANERSGCARRPAAVHAEHRNDGLVETFDVAG